jgi:hypothetical protein
MGMPHKAFGCLMFVLSLCVFFLGLGIPTTSFLSVLVPGDNLEASILEGLSLPTSVYYRQDFTVSTTAQPNFSYQPRVFDSSLFHPPIG